VIDVGLVALATVDRGHVVGGDAELDEAAYFQAIERQRTGDFACRDLVAGRGTAVDERSEFGSRYQSEADSSREKSVFAKSWVDSPHDLESSCQRAGESPHSSETLSASLGPPDRVLFDVDDRQPPYEVLGRMA
jgi:hypothetical protein